MFNRIIYFPHKLGQRKNGVELAPLIMKHFFNKELASFELEDSNDLFCNLQNLYKVNQSFKGKRVNIGGDHSMSIATVAHTFNNFPKSKILWVDAHADINTKKSSSTGNLHGMPLASVFNIMEPIIESEYQQNYDQLIYLGLRDIDDFERKLLDKKGITYYTTDCIRKTGLNNVLNLVKKSSKNNIHLSFDIDVLDPHLVPATGTPVDNGLLLKESSIILNFLKENKNITTFDLVEFNPYLFDVDNRTLRNSIEIINKIIKI